MKRNTLMKRLAVTALAATMTFGTLPVAAFADTQVNYADEGGKVNEDKATVGELALKDTLANIGDYTATVDSSALDVQEILAKGINKTNRYHKVAISSVTLGTATAPKYEITANKTEITSYGVINGTAKVYVEEAAKDDGTGKEYDVSFSLDANELSKADTLTVLDEYVNAHLADKLSFKNDTTIQGAQAAVDSLKNEAFATILNGKYIKMDTNEAAVAKDVDAKVTSVTADPAATETTTGTSKVAVTYSLGSGKDITKTYDLGIAKDGAKLSRTETVNDAVATKSATYTGEIATLETSDDTLITLVANVIKNVDLTNQDFTIDKNGKLAAVGSSAYTAIQDALDTDITLQNNKVTVDTITLARDNTYNKATHATNSTADLVVTFHKNTNADKKLNIEKVTVPVVHSEADIEEEARVEVRDALNLLKASDFQADNATTAPSDEEVKKVIEDKIQAALAKTLGGTKSIADEIDSFEVTSFNYEPATVDSEGTINRIHITLTFKVPEDNDADTLKTMSVWFGRSGSKVTLPKLVAVEASSIELGADRTGKGVVTITPELKDKNGADANTAANVELSWTNDAQVKVYKNSTQSTPLVNGAKVGLKAGDKLIVVNANTGETGPQALATTTLTATLWNKEDSKRVMRDSVNVKVSGLFDDVQDPNVYYFDPVYKLADVGVIAGTSESTYAPTANVTRGQFVSFLYRLAKDQTVTAQDLKAAEKFTDVKADAYYANAVAWAFKNQIVAGTTDTTFAPNKTVTRAEAVTFLARAAKVLASNGDSYTATQFEDVPSGRFYSTAVAWAVSNNITSGVSATKFAPTDLVTRAQAAKFIYQFSSANVIDGYKTVD